MSYQVLARKYRPQTFDEVIGQDAVVTTLKNAIEANRIHQAYLFTGVRGTGKTSLARIFAKALNCENLKNANPCNECSNCKQITQGSSLDVLEIDGASNTSVDDVRDLREQLKYVPNSGKYKIFIIDEVHMLSTSAFNALLKTLEEPPPHALFLMATTENHKIPATILSRCQRFDLRRVALETLQNILKTMCEKEAVIFEADALLMIAREAQGSIRDAQSLLDQAIAYSSGEIKSAVIEAMLGLTTHTQLQKMLSAILQKNLEQALIVLNEVYDRGHDLKQLYVQCMEWVKNLLLYSASESNLILQDLTESEQKFIQTEYVHTTKAVLEMMFQILHQGIQELSYSEFPKMIAEVLLFRLAYASQFYEVTSLLEGGQQSDVISSVPVTHPTIKAPSIKNESSNANSESELASQNSSQTTIAPQANLKSFLDYAGTKRPQVASILSQVLAIVRKENELIVKVEPGSHWLEWLKDREEVLQNLALDCYKRKMKFVFLDAELTGSFDEVLELQKPKSKEVLSQQSSDVMVQKAMSILNAKIAEVKS